MSASLADEGYPVKCARSGDEGLRMIEEYRPNVVLLDIWMPDIDGLEVLRRIRKDKSLTALPPMARTTRPGVPNRLVNTGIL